MATDKAITAQDYALREKCKDTRDRIRKMAGKHGLHLYEEIAGIPVKAVLDFGRWIARCECGGAEAVDPSDPIFFCVSCGNYRNSGRLRRVEFPADYKKIERQVMGRAVEYGPSDDPIEKQRRAVPAGEPRSWRPE